MKARLARYSVKHAYTDQVTGRAVRGDIVLAILSCRRGTQNKVPHDAFFDSRPSPHNWLSFSDGVQIFRRGYFLVWEIIVARSTSSALAILRHVSRRGLRFSFSIKLIVARLRPVFSASLSCDKPFSVRTAIRLDTIFAASFSDSSSLITKDNQTLAQIFIRNYSKRSSRRLICAFYS